MTHKKKHTCFQKISEVDPIRPTFSIVYANEISKIELGSILALNIWASTSVGSLPGWLIKLRDEYLQLPNKKHGPSSTGTGVNKNGGASLRNRGTNSWRVPRCSAVPVVMQWPWPCRCRHDARVPQRPPCGHAPGYAPARSEKNKASTHFSSQTCLSSSSSSKKKTSLQTRRMIKLATSS